MKSLHKETQAIKSVQALQDEVKPVAMPIYLSTTYEREPDGGYKNDYIYSRNANPNRTLLENSLALLEGGAVAYAFSSGMAAITAVLQLLKTGDHILLPDDVYYKIRMVLDETFERWGLSYSLVDMSDVKSVSSAIKENTKLIWLETPSNPMLKITDIVAVSNLAKSRGILTVVDNTWATPILLNPLNLGADIVIHSTTKYFGGHSDVLGGAVICKESNELSQSLQHIQVGGGAVPSPFDSWLIARGISTLPLRIKAQSQTAMQLAQYLESHTAIEQVYYPGLESHAGYDIAKAQMNEYYGAMLSIQIKRGEQVARKVCNALKLFTQATSLGGVESLVEHRKSVEGPDSYTPENLLRISVGLEHVEDLIADFDEALKLQ